MELTRWIPKNDMFSLRRHMNHLFDDVFKPAVANDHWLSEWNRQPIVDIYDNDDNIVIKAELPGIDKKDIDIDVKNGVLTLKGERRVDNETKKDKYYRRERAFGRFERAFRLPAEVDPENINASYKDGVLTIDIPKPENQKTKQISVN